MRKIKVKSLKEKFYTPQEVQVIREKMAGIKYPNNYRNEKVMDLINEYGEERTRKLIEEEVYLFKNTMIFMGNEESYKALNGNEEKMVAYALANKNQIMRNSMYEYLEMELTLVS